MLKLGNSTPSNIALGSTIVQRAYLGNTLVWDIITELLGKPFLLNFHVKDLYPSRLYFDSTGDVSGMTSTGFECLGNDNIVTAIINGQEKSGHYFVMSNAFDFWDNNLVRCQGGDGTVLDFPWMHIVNYIEAPIPSKWWYVDSEVASSGSGTSQGSPFKTIGEATSVAVAGEGIYVKKGTYVEQVGISRSGNSTEPIHLIGYENTPGDEPFVDKVIGMSFDGDVMPRINGSTHGISMSNRDYWVIKNFMINSYSERGINIDDSNYLHIENVYVEGGQSGVWNNGNAQTNVRVLNSLSQNHAFHGFKLAGQYMMVKGSVAGTSFASSNDYYIGFNGHVSGGYGNQIINNRVERFDGESHTGHGCSFKGSDSGAAYIRDGLIQGNEVLNCRGSIELRHGRVINNVVRGNIVRSSSAAGKGTTMAIKCRDGANNNLIIQNHIYDADAFVRFHWSGEDDQSGVGDTAGNNNIFENNLIHDCNTFCLADSGSEANNNKFYHNTVVNCNSLLSISIPFSGNVFQNNIVQDCDSNDNQGTWNYNCFYSNGFSNPSGTGNFTQNPSLNSAYKPQAIFSSLEVPHVAGVRVDHDNLERNATSTTVGWQGAC